MGKGDKKKRSHAKKKDATKKKLVNSTTSKQLVKVKTKSKGKSKNKDNKGKKFKKGYQRGDLGRAMNALFDKVGVDKVTFEQALAVAKKAKPDTTYGSSYFSWHKNHYRNIKLDAKIKAKRADANSDN